MKIVRMKMKKDECKRDMFAVLCLVQSAVTVIIILLLFVFTRVNSDVMSGIHDDLSVIFGEDMDIGGYFTPSEEKETLENTAYQVNFVSYEEKVSVGSSEEEASEDSAFDYFDAPAVMPVIGTVTSDYGYREHPVYSGDSFHEGRDIAADEGSPVYAVLDGVVIDAGTAEMAGNYVRLLHPDGRETLYCHCSQLLVEEGVSVRKGDVIALVGQTGLATGPHLHFELHENGETLDPEIILADAVNVD